MAKVKKLQTRKVKKTSLKGVIVEKIIPDNDAEKRRRWVLGLSSRF